MSWRTLYINSQAHLSFKNNYLIVRNEEIRQIHISEINTIIIDNNLSTISTYLLNELINNNVKIIFCNEKHNPSMEVMPYKVSYESSRIIMKELKWNDLHSKKLWMNIIKSKIKNQSHLLFSVGLDAYKKLDLYIDEVELDDVSNREGHAAKVYFNALFGKDFSRDKECDINAYLDYGYTILLSMFNRAIVSHGYLTQIGLHHKGPTNPFNLSCDLMEPFRPIVDQYTISHINDSFDSNRKKELVNIINSKVKYMNKDYYLHNAIDIYVNNLLSSFDTSEIKDEWFYYVKE